MNIRKKTPAELEHQVADYLLNGENHPDNMRAVYLGRIAKTLLQADPSNLTNNPTLHEQNPKASSEDFEAFVERYPAYLNSRSKDSEERRLYKEKSAAVKRYQDEFAPLVAAIDPGADTGLFSGSYAKPYLIEKDGQNYIVRAIEPRSSLRQVEKHLDATLRVRGIDHMEQVIAVSYTDGITVAPQLPGKSFRQLEWAGYAQDVTEVQLRDLYAAMKAANARGVGFDGVGGNILYDPKHGFSVIDMGALETQTPAAAALVDQLQYLMSDASSGSNLEYMQQIDRIVGEVEKIFAEDDDAKDDLEWLRAVRQTKLVEGMERVKAIDDLHRSFEYAGEYEDEW